MWINWGRSILSPGWSVQFLSHREGRSCRRRRRKRRRCFRRPPRQNIFGWFQNWDMMIFLRVQARMTASMFSVSWIGKSGEGKKSAHSRQEEGSCENERIVQQASESKCAPARWKRPARFVVITESVFESFSFIVCLMRPEFHDYGQPQSRRSVDRKSHRSHFGPRRPTASRWRRPGRAAAV